MPSIPTENSLPLRAIYNFCQSQDKIWYYIFEAVFVIRSMPGAFFVGKVFYHVFDTV